ncbi:MAG: type II toxin-antitoxin system RelE/ParE family toxin [Proteobacteria bacterium]|nr:type II toxin-antitoxin system RelE/ParE family toxin [Pseudomonadota bacterium]MBU4356043.1 type II toxin-antitoxin system RelE/ParE family toxin [Pseudomonadota bacterium]
MKYAVSLTKEAIKELERLDRRTEQRIQRRLDELALNPYDPRISNEVKMVPGQRYSRVGDRRIFFEVKDSSRQFEVIAIRPRGRAYSKN